MPGRLSKGLIVMLLCSCAIAANASDRASLGQVQFANSCKPEVQARFLEAVALLHSFEYKEAEQDFQHVEESDPACAIAAWGMAFADTERLGAGASPKVLAAGWSQLQPWLLKKPGTEREQMYLDAVRAMYEGYDRTSSGTRWNRYLERMDAIRQRYPDDVNASLFYALGLAWTAGPGEQGLVQRRKALAILLPIFQEYPDNPGAAHYIIHAADTPELASVALPAARKYAAIAPDAPHALHMPSHIFNRLGLWQESIDSNLASARVAAQWVKEGRGGGFDQLHALNNLEYGYLQLGQYDKARSVIEQIDQAAAGPNGDPWAKKDAQIYYDLETGDWRDALQLQPPPNATFQESFDIYWVHTIAAARVGGRQEAEGELEKFRKSSLEWGKDHTFGAEIFHLALLQAEAWVQFAEGKHEEALNGLGEAERFEKDHPMYYADILPRPSSEMRGDMLSEMGRSAEALAAYQAALNVAPNRLDSLRGATKAAEKSGNTKLAKEYGKKLRAENAVTAIRP
jgi:tetratricopeptide (TPR) repeat protein